jgi:hypothetical protein
MTDWRNEVARWWEDRWWLADEYVRVYEERISPERVDQCISAVARVFDKNWVWATEAHPVYQYLLMKGLDPLEFLVSLGRNLLGLEGSVGFRRVLEDLRNPGNFSSAILELSLAALLREAGHEIGFRPCLANGKESDLVARLGGQEVFIEVKVLRESQSAQALGEFTTWLGVALGDAIRSAEDGIAELQYQIELDPELATALGAGPEVDSKVISGLIERTRNEVAENLQRGNHDFCIPHIGSFVIRPKNVLPNSSLSYRGVSPSFEIRRIMQSRLHEAIKQLPPEHPGVIVIRTAGVLDEGQSRLVIESFLKSVGSQGSHVSGVVFLPVFYFLPTRWSPFQGFAVVNPSARVPPSSLHAFRTIAEQCNLSCGLPSGQ